MARRGKTRIINGVRYDVELLHGIQADACREVAAHVRKHATKILSAHYGATVSNDADIFLGDVYTIAFELEERANKLAPDDGGGFDTVSPEVQEQWLQRH